MSMPVAAQSLVSVQRFSTDAFAAHDRVAAWREAYGRTIAKLEFEPEDEAPFAVEATLRELPDVGLASLATQGLRFSKPANLIDTDDLILVVIESGSYSGRQLGREVTLGPGDAVIRLNSEITSGRILGRPSIVRVPMRAVAARTRDVGTHVHRRIPADTDALCLLRPYMRMIRESAATTPELQRVAARHVHDLVTLLLDASRDTLNAVEAGGLRAARLQAIKDDVARNLPDGDISIGAVALRQRVTPRTIQKLFETEGETLTEYVLGLRLARAHRLLSDPRCASEKIAALAFDAGFNDVSSFYRAFRRRYGVAPADVRAGAAPQARP